MATFDSVAADKAQEAYCNENDVPHFAPVCCYRCGQNIYSPIQHEHPTPYTSGICVEVAGSTLITGCPHCHASFVD